MNLFTLENLHTKVDLFSSIFAKEKNTKNGINIANQKESKNLQKANQVLHEEKNALRKLQLNEVDIYSTNQDDNTSIKETSSTKFVTEIEICQPKLQDEEEIKNKGAVAKPQKR